MIANEVVSKFSELIKKAEAQTIIAIKEGRVETEPSVTDRFLESVENVFRENGKYQGLEFKARTLKDKGKNAAEKRYGADFVGVLQVKIPGFEMIKGFLSQAKSEGNGAKIDLNSNESTVLFKQDKEFQRLKGQTSQMLKITPDSFVIVYGSNGFVMVPATSVNGLTVEEKLHAKPVALFFEELLMCFIGDPAIIAWDDETLDACMFEMRARAAIFFSIRKTSEKFQRDSCQ